MPLQFQRVPALPAAVDGFLKGLSRWGRNQVEPCLQGFFHKWAPHDSIGTRSIALSFQEARAQSIEKIACMQHVSGRKYRTTTHNPQRKGPLKLSLKIDQNHDQGCRSMRTLTSTNPIRWKGRTLFLLSVMLFFCCIGCDKKEIPKDLSGKWITDKPAYEDCGLEITKDWIVFSKGLTHKLFYSITKIEDITSKDSDKTLYKIYYEDEDGYEYTLSLFYYHTEEGDVLQIKHQKQLLWKRKNAS